MDSWTVYLVSTVYVDNVQRHTYGRQGHQEGAEAFQELSVVLSCFACLNSKKQK